MDVKKKERDQAKQAAYLAENAFLPKGRSYTSIIRTNAHIHLRRAISSFERHTRRISTTLPVNSFSHFKELVPYLGKRVSDVMIRVSVDEDGDAMEFLDVQHQQPCGVSFYHAKVLSTNSSGIRFRRVGTDHEGDEWADQELAWDEAVESIYVIFRLHLLAIETFVYKKYAKLLSKPEPFGSFLQGGPNLIPFLKMDVFNIGPFGIGLSSSVISHICDAVQTIRCHHDIFTENVMLKDKVRILQEGDVYKKKKVSDKDKLRTKRLRDAVYELGYGSTETSGPRLRLETSGPRLRSQSTPSRLVESIRESISIDE